jgi:hypothetical protein
MSRILPARFYSADPMDLADELIRARQDDAEYQARRLIERAMTVPVSAAEIPRRYLDISAKRARIRALVAKAKKG